MRSFGLDAGPGGLVPPQPDGWAHLVSVRSGVAELRCERLRAFVTPGAGVWIPSGMPYALDFRTPVLLRILYVDAAVAPVRPFGAVVMNPLLRELVDRAMATGYLDSGDERHARVLSVLRDELEHLSDAGSACVLTFPDDSLLRSVAEFVLQHPDEMVRIADLAARANVSVRTFERRFTLETGRSPREWLRRARLAGALASLASGASVTEAGFSCGYSSISAFVSAFRTVYGVTPGSFAR